MSALEYLKPWLFDPFAAIGLGLGLGVYSLGLWRGARPGFGRALAYLVGVLVMYAVLHTYLDYYGQYLFSGHRAQHLVLHHLGPFLIAFADPGPVWRRAFGGRVTFPGWLKVIYRIFQNPVVAPILFVGLIYFWLIPEIHFYAMLDRELYLLMNWSMAIDGLLFWWLMLVPRGPGHLVDLGYGTRILILILVMFPQIVLGAYIALGPEGLYDVYSVCGRALTLSPAQDQLYGGLITWIPAAMMSVLGAVIVLSRWMHDDAQRQRS